MLLRHGDGVDAENFQAMFIMRRLGRGSSTGMCSRERNEGGQICRSAVCKLTKVLMSFRKLMPRSSSKEAVTSARLEAVGGAEERPEEAGV